MLKSEQTATITELRKDPKKLFKEAKKLGTPIYIFFRSKPEGVILNIEEYNAFLQRLEDLADAIELKEAVETSGKKELIPFEKFWKKNRLAAS